MPNARPIDATRRPMFPSPTTPSVRPCSPKPIVCCQPPSRIRRSSAGTCRTRARISAQVSSGVAAPLPPVPHTVTPAAAAAATSIDALRIPVVTSSRRSGSSRSRSAVNGVRSRIATTTSNGRNSAARSAVSAMCPWNGTTSVAPSDAQSALCRATR